MIPDNVNHPSHYETGSFECIDVMLETQGMEATLSFCTCNAFKYLYRHKNKNGLEDIKKANWYLNKYIELAEKEMENDNRVKKCLSMSGLGAVKITKKNSEVQDV